MPGNIIRIIMVNTILASFLMLHVYRPPLAFAEGEAKEDSVPVADRLARNVVFIYALMPDPAKGDGGTKVEGGTGFIVRHNDRSYFVTAKHVISGALEVKILTNRRAGFVAWVPVSKIEEGSPGSTWITDPAADLAIHPFYPPSLGQDFVSSWIFGKTLYEGKAYLLDRLLAIGFPYTIGSVETSEQLSPVVKETRLVSWPAFRDFSSESNLLVDPPLYPGFSGSPIYSLDEPPGLPQFRQRHTTLIGVYVGNLLIRNEDFLGRVVPTKKLIDLLNSEPVKAYEKTSRPLDPIPSPEEEKAP